MPAITDPQSRIRKDCASFPVPPVQSGGPIIRHFRLAGRYPSFVQDGARELITYRTRGTGGSIDVRSQCCWSALAGSGYLSERKGNASRSDVQARATIRPPPGPVQITPQRRVNCGSACVTVAHTGSPAHIM